MLTVVICALLILVICVAWWHDESKGAIGWSLVALLLVFGGMFPLCYGSHVAEKGEVVKIYTISEIDDTHYYLNDAGVWVDIVHTPDISQSDNTSVVKLKGKPSMWYWPLSHIKATVVIK